MHKVELFKPGDVFIPEAIELLRSDEHYYGEFGKKFMSNSDIIKLEDEPENFKGAFVKTVPLLAGGLFHTYILEPEKVDGNFPFIDASSRNTTKYKTACQGELTLLKKEYDATVALAEKMMNNMNCKPLIYGNVEYEVPAVLELGGVLWKGKADIINRDLGLIVDLKTTSDIKKFRNSAYSYNYDSQAYLYQKMFGMPMVFLVICKKTGKIKLFECSERFIESGKAKVEEALIKYNDYFVEKSVDPYTYVETLEL